MNARIAALAALLLLSGCAGTSSSDSPVKGKPIDPQAQAQANLLAEVDGLKSQVQRLSAEVEDLNLQIRTMTDGDGSGGATTLPELSKRIQKVEGNLKQMGSQLGVEVDGQQPGAGQPHDPGAPAPGPQGNQAPGQPQVNAPAAQNTQAAAQPQAQGRTTDVPAAKT